jgi:hypothetical protein
MIVHKTRKLTIKVAASMIVLTLAACQSSQQEQAMEEGLGVDNGLNEFGNEEGFDNFGNDGGGFADGEGMNNFENNFGDFENNFDNQFAEGDGFNDTGFNDQFVEGEAINSDTGNEFAFNDGGGGNNLFSNQDFQGEQFGDQAMFANQGQDFGFENDNPLFNQGEQAMFGNNQGMFANDQGMQNAAMQEEPINMEPVSDDTGMMAPQGGGLVKYVLQDGTALRDQPAGSSIRSLEQGDHPLVFDEGEWSRTSDGYYVSTIEITPDPVPRRKIKANWTY